MLTKHEKKSRSQLMAGTGAVAVLLIGGLGLTASGTQAAETVRTSVESATGVDLASIELPALPQSTPLPPPPGPPVPPAPAEGTDVHRTVTTTSDGKGTVRQTVVVMRDKDGKTTTRVTGDGAPRVLHFERKGGKREYVFRDDEGKTVTWDMVGPPPAALARLRDMPELTERLKSMPEVSSRACSDAEGKKGEHVIRREEGDKKIMIICTNRIERIAALSAGDAQRIGDQSYIFRRRAEGSALEGLRSARRSIESNRSMGDTQRAAALSGIDEAIREMEAKKDKD